MTRMRPMRSEDLEWVARSEREIREFAWGEIQFADSLAAGHLCRILEDGQKALGYAVVMQVLDEAHLLNIGIARAEQRKGLGAFFLEQLCEQMAQSGAASFFLEVAVGNAPALRLYQRLGFETIGRRKAYYPATGGGREDALVMKRDLSGC
ncbi:ribosomal protein S18-alanine N-acetyltransferase [Niveibacterium terrae]|uniref:ribosomal protein S18-alanine N-acetyltransferase n=1 Tax=Niveibacterium terrae TaxID=3373598 RepID=UPI003A8DD059